MFLYWKIHAQACVMPATKAVFFCIKALSSWLPQQAEKACEPCADFCNVCALECARIGEDEIMRSCAAACRECAQMCRCSTLCISGVGVQRAATVAARRLHTGAA
jgi:hypothetical protein